MNIDSKQNLCTDEALCAAKPTKCTEQTPTKIKNKGLQKQALHIAKPHIFAIILGILLIMCALFSLCVGSEYIPFTKLLRANGLDEFDKIIIFSIRLPRILLCIISGALLGGTAAVLQGFFRNPLSDSGILGISSGATLGAVLSGFFTFGTLHALLPVSLFAFAGSIVSGVCVYGISRVFGRSGTVTLLLAGTALGTFFSSISSMILILREKELHALYVWTLGSFNGKSINDVAFIALPSIVSLVLLCVASFPLDALGGGEKTAQSLGVDVTKTRTLILAASSLATACAVCAGGIISFAGLVSPHIVRRLASSLNRFLVPLSMLTGAFVLLVSDTVARTVASPSEIPVGIVTALIGVPFFIAILLKEKKGFVI